MESENYDFQKLESPFSQGLIFRWIIINFRADFQGIQAVTFLSPWLAGQLSIPNKVTKNCQVPGTPSVLFVLATLPLKAATIALKIGHLAFQVLVFQCLLIFCVSSDNFANPSQQWECTDQIQKHVDVLLSLVEFWQYSLFKLKYSGGNLKNLEWPWIPSLKLTTRT